MRLRSLDLRARYFRWRQVQGFVAADLPELRQQHSKACEQRGHQANGRLHGPGGSHGGSRFARVIFLPGLAWFSCRQLFQYRLPQFLTGFICLIIGFWMAAKFRQFFVYQVLHHTDEFQSSFAPGLQFFNGVFRKPVHIGCSQPSEQVV